MLWAAVVLGAGNGIKDVLFLVPRPENFVRGESSH